MQESKESWNIEELVTEMESMQAEMDSLYQQIADLKSENQKLSEENLKLQSIIQDLMKELQQKSDQLVKQSSADLILKENEMLKEKDRKREIESNRRKEELEAEVTAVKDAFIESSDELEKLKNLQKKKILEYDQKINEQNKLIDECAEQKFKKLRSSLEKKYRKENDKLSAAYTARNTALLSQLFSSIIYAAIVTLLTAARSNTFIEDIKNFFKGFTDILIKYS